MIDDFGIRLTHEFDKFINESDFSDDHWRVLRLIGKSIEKKGFFLITPNPQMRTTTRHYKIASGSRFMKPNEGTKLKNGNLIIGHDDWDILRDFAEADFFTVREGATSIKPKRRVKFSEKGLEYYNKHKS